MCVVSRRCGGLGLLSDLIPPRRWCRRSLTPTLGMGLTRGASYHGAAHPIRCRLGKLHFWAHLSLQQYSSECPVFVTRRWIAKTKRERGRPGASTQTHSQTSTNSKARCPHARKWPTATTMPWLHRRVSLARTHTPAHRDNSGTRGGLSHVRGITLTPLCRVFG